MNGKISNEKLKSLIVSAVVLVVGILFCCSLAMGVKGLSILISISLFVVGVLYMIMSVMHTNKLFTSEGILGAAIFAFGVLFIANDLAWLIFNYIPWILMAVGIVIIVDGFLSKFKNFDSNTKFIFELILGIFALVLGICLRFIAGFSDYAALILGIIMIVYAIFSVFSTLTNKETF